MSKCIPAGYVAGVYYYLSLRLLFRYIVTRCLLEKLRFGLLDLVRASSSDVSGEHILPTLLVCRSKMKRRVKIKLKPLSSALEFPRRRLLTASASAGTHRCVRTYLFFFFFLPYSALLNLRGSNSAHIHSTYPLCNYTAERFRACRSDLPFQSSSDLHRNVWSRLLDFIFGLLKSTSSPTILKYF